MYENNVLCDFQEKVYGELQDIFDDSDRDCTMNDFPKMKYLDCCIKETLRIYPSLPMIERKTLEDMQIGTGRTWRSR